MTAPVMDGPVREFFERLEPLAAAPQPDMPAIGGLLVDLSRDSEYLDHHIERVREGGGKPIYAPERGPRLLIVHRGEGQMGAIHSHKVWVAIAPIVGTETHRLYAVGDKRKAALTEELHLDAQSREFATLLPPNDVHAHGHVRGIGDPAFCLILTGDNQVLFEREQYDSATGDCMPLPPGNAGDWLDPRA